MTITTGTAHFVNLTKACDYYRGQGCDDLTPAALELYVKGMIEDGEIHLGKPEINPGQRLLLIDGGTRYAIEG